MSLKRWLHGSFRTPSYRWKSKYADMGISEVRRLKAMEAENTRLKRIVADQALDIDALRHALLKKD